MIRTTTGPAMPAALLLALAAFFALAALAGAVSTTGPIPDGVTPKSFRDSCEAIKGSELIEVTKPDGTITSSHCTIDGFEHSCNWVNKTCTDDLLKPTNGGVGGPVDDGVLDPGSNAAPTAAGDAYVVAEDRVLRRDAARGVLANDADFDGDALTARLVKGPAKGTLRLKSDGSFVYKPKRNFHGTVSFTYEVADGRGGTATATATIKVLARPN